MVSIWHFFLHACMCQQSCSVNMVEATPAWPSRMAPSPSREVHSFRPPFACYRHPPMW